MLRLIKKIINQGHEDDVFRTLPGPMIIAVDFDGTCVTERYPDVGEEMPGCTETLKALVNRGHKLVLWTCREGHKLEDAVEWFEGRKIPLVGINETPLEDDFRQEGGRKVFANLYIDDKAFGGFPGWHKVHHELLGMPLMA
ncbi:MAG: hypothetical protein NE330_22110 [Lentisphaeraceae bacterium]|nr:hypothetical protein [Lentisphaeraceae bacterium]